MNTFRYAIALAFIFSLTACGSKPKPLATLLQSKCDPPAGLRLPEQLKVYHLGRTATPSEMHEAHPVYRIEESARWNLSGLGENPARPGFTPPILLDETKAELYRQREISKTMNEEARRLGDSVKELSATTATIRELSDRQREFSKRLEQLERRLPASTNSISR